MGPAFRVYSVVILGLIVALAQIGLGDAAAVMSVDLGSEWMKVRLMNEKLEEFHN